MIDILLATFNGEKFLEQQINSIFNQTFTNWKLIIHDDGSTDNTVDIINSFVEVYPEKIFFIKDNIKTGGAKSNFAHLMMHSSSRYIMFCDQDDVWLESKIKDTLIVMNDLELKYCKTTPLLVFSDLTVVDSTLNIIYKSMNRAQKLNPSIAESLELLSCQNVITGCTIMINQIALQISNPIPDDALMHDWWIALKVCESGKISYLDKSTILYRQHNNNTLGFKRFSMLYLLKKLIQFDLLLYYNNLKDMNQHFNLKISKLRYFYIKLKVLFMRLKW